MKTVISIDEELLREADEAARLMGLSRRRLFALAVGEFLQRQRLNAVYANGLGPAEKRLLKKMKFKVARIVKESWWAKSVRDK
jgi:hypothetical protein